MNKIIDAVEKNSKLILEAERYIWNNPETGYKEFKTSKYMSEKFEELGYELVYAEGITGFYTVVDTGIPGPTVLVMGELDSIICPAHKDADPETGAVHSCGHNAQCAALLGVAAALKEPGILEGMCGKIMLCAVPAEELLEIEFRSNLIKEGKIKYYGGKTEFLYRGYFDDVDLAFMVHTSDSYEVIDGSVGCIAKKVIYKGKSAHAGSSPWHGCNALYAATCGLNAINSIRETFKESDIIRVHPIITHGGDMVNAIPETVTLESYIRGLSFKGIVEANNKVNRALCGAALSLGANVDIQDMPGYSPNMNSEDLAFLFYETVKEILPQYDIKYNRRYSSGSTDMGDLSCVMPTVHPYAGGSTGTCHGNDYQIADPIAACVDSAKAQVVMLNKLLSNKAEVANNIIKNFKPLFSSIKEFLEFVDSLNRAGDRIKYNDSSVEIDL